MKNLRNLVILAGLIALVFGVTTCKGGAGDPGGTPVSNPVPQTPGAPVVIAAGDGFLTVKWTAVEDAEKYEVYCSETQSMPVQPQSTVLPTTATLSGLTNKTTYYVRIKAVNKNGSSAFSPYARGIPWPDHEVPAVPKKPVIIPGTNQLTVTWEECGGASSYEVYHSPSPSTPYYYMMPSVTSNTTSAVITNLENDVIYFIWVRAVNNWGKSDYSPVESGTPKIPTSAPAAPEIPLLIPGSRELTVVWQAVELAAAYEVWFGTSDNVAQAQQYGYYDIPGSITETIIHGLTNETTYYVWIKAKNIIGTSGFSPSANAKPSVFAAVPVTPDTPTVVAGNRELTVSWQAAEGALSYEVWGGDTEYLYGAHLNIYVGDLSGTSVTLTNLWNGTTYYIWVKAKNDVGESDFSPMASGTPSPFAARPSAPQSAPTVTAGSGQLTVSWQEAEGALVYEVWAGTTINPTTATKRVEDVSDLSAVITGLVNGTTYYVWIKAKNNFGTSDFSPMASGMPSAFTVIPQAPSAPTMGIGDDQLTVTWTAVEGALSYEIWLGTSNDSALAVKNGADESVSLSHTVSGLSNGTMYYIWLRAKNNIGTSGFSPFASGKPIGTAATPTIAAGNGQLTVNWTPITGADEYEVLYGTGTNPPQTASQTLSATPTTITGLTNGTNYSVWVRGKNSTGTGPVSAAASAKPIDDMGAVTVISGNGQLTLNWAAVAGADDYEVYHSEASTMPGTASQTISTITATISGLTNGTTYYVWVKPKNDNGTGTVSTVASGVPLATPGNLTVSAANQQITVSWDPVPGAVSYEVYRGTTTTIPASPSDTAETLNHTFTGLTNGTTYYFWVKAVNANGTSGASPEASAKPIGNMGTVTLTTGGSGQLVLSWEPVAGADEYEVYYGEASTMPGTPSQTVSPTTATISGLTIGTPYYVWVKAKNADGYGGTSAIASGVLVAAPGGLTVSAANQQITVSWASVPGATSYQVYHSTSTTIPGSPSVTVTTTSGTITGLTNGTTYYFWVKAVNTTGTSGASPVASAKPIGNMGVVTLTTGGSGQLVLSWSTVAGADQYDVYHNTSNSIPASPAQTVSATAATISGLTNGTTYYLWVKPKNANGTGTVSASASGVPMATPGNLTVSAANQQITVSWASVPGATSYQVFYSTSATIPASPSDTITGMSKTFTSLTNGTTYYFWVKAVNANGSSGASPQASGKPIGNMGTVTLTSGNGQVSVSWPTVAGADQYEVYHSEASTIPETPSQAVSTTTATITGLANGTLYHVWLKPKNANGTGEVSTVVMAKPLGMPEARLTMGFGNLRVTWTAVPGADEYEVYYGTDTPITLATTTSGTTAIISGLTNGTTYFVRLLAKNANGSVYGAITNCVPGSSPGLYRGINKIGDQNLSSSLSYIYANAVTGDNFYIVLGADESISPMSLSYSGKTVGITLIGYGGERTITLNSNGTMFDVRGGVTLTLDENVTLVGRSENTGNLVYLASNGSFIMNSGSITRNTEIKTDGGGVRVVAGGAFTMYGGSINGNSTNYSGGGVSVIGGTFIMYGGEIFGNSVSSSSSYSGGGVSVGASGNFRIVNGTVYGSNAAEGLKNTANSGAALFGIAQRGTFNGGVWVSKGNIPNSDNTIRVVNGDLQ